MKHIKLEYDDATYAIIRVASAMAGVPIRHWVARAAAEVASQRTGTPLPVTAKDEDTALYIPQTQEPQS